MGKKILLEFDPSDPYLDSVRDFALESSRGVVLVVTRSNSPLHQLLSKNNGIRFLALSPATSYPREGSSENEILLPYGDDSIILDAISKTIRARTELETAVIFDTLSDLTMTFGNEKTYNFLVHVLEIFSSPKITALFLLNSGACDSRLVSSIKSLFAVHLRQENERLTVVRQI